MTLPEIFKIIDEVGDFLTEDIHKSATYVNAIDDMVNTLKDRLILQKETENEG